MTWNISVNLQLRSNVCKLLLSLDEESSRWNLVIDGKAEVY